jgi:transcriptional regulator with XRE-family HTH domain
MDAETDSIKPARMGKTPKKTKPRRVPTRTRTLYLGQWLAVLGRKQGEVAEAIGMNEGYMSSLISGKYGREPGTQLILDISEELGISVNALFSPPPSRDVAGEVGRLSSKQWAAFLEVLAMRPNREPRD